MTVDESEGGFQLANKMLFLANVFLARLHGGWRYFDLFEGYPAEHHEL